MLTCVVALGHASQALGWYFAYSPLPPTLAVLQADTSFAQWHGLPFIPFGLLALAILCVLAATTHDFWLAFLTPPVWKALHMLIYLACASVVLHVAFGVLQDQRNPLLATLVMPSAVGVCGLHAIAGRRECRRDSNWAAIGDDGWLDAARIDGVEEGRAVVVHRRDGEPVAIFRHQGKLSAVSNLCAHQNGPLGEGRVIDGCITCPWHGFQYRLEDGCAPPPYTERIATYRLRLDGERVLLDPRPNPPGTWVEPLIVVQA